MISQVGGASTRAIPPSTTMVWGLRVEGVPPARPSARGDRLRTSIEEGHMGGPDHKARYLTQVEAGRSYADRLTVWARWLKGYHPGPGWAQTDNPEDEALRMISDVEWSYDHPTRPYAVLLDNSPDSEVRIIVPPPGEGPYYLQVLVSSVATGYTRWQTVNHLLETEHLMAMRSFVTHCFP